MHPSSATSSWSSSIRSLLPRPSEHVVFANLALLLGLGLAVRLMLLWNAPAGSAGDLSVDGMVAVLATVALGGVLWLGWRRLAASSADFGSRLARASAGWERVVGTAVSLARRRPLATIWLAALLGVLASCYPVVFGGKSFVASRTVQELYYGRMPNLPGTTGTRTETQGGVDMAATMWQCLPYSVLEHRAIFRDGELPVWNRYDAGGLPLLGQGQSMLGDPLNALVVLTGGQSWAWDLKFLAARLLFAAGAGLAVRAATGRLAGAAVLTFGACFLGFFVYRFNHPANFVLCYSPWILFAWLRIVRGPGVGVRAALPRVGLLLLACWQVLGGGAVKEGAFLLLGLNATGLLLLVLDDRRSWRWKGRCLLGLGWAFTCFFLVSAPLWRTLLDAIATSWNNYEQAPVFQIQPGALIGLFDDIFYRQFNSSENPFCPSANFLVLLGVMFALGSWRTLAGRSRVFLALSVCAAVSLAMVFGVVSSSWIRATPFLGRLMHVDNTFTCVALVPLLVLAGFGLEHWRERLDAPTWVGDYLTAAALPLLGLALFLGTAHASQHAEFSPIPLGGPTLPLSDFFRGYVAVSLAALLVLPLLWRWTQRAGAAALVGAGPWLLAGLMALVWRGGIHLHGVVNWNDFVLHAAPRSHLLVRTPALDRLDAVNQAEPGRVFGLRNNLVSGYAGALGLESPCGPDALQNRYYHDLITASKTLLVWNWLMLANRFQVADPTVHRFYDLLNIRYYADQPEPGSTAAPDVPGLRTLGRYDLDLYESPTAWPRAFFTDNLVPCRDSENLLRILQKSDGRPFAAVSPDELRARPDLDAFAPLLRGPGGDGGRVVVGAVGYRLTSRTTSFRVQAPGPGVAVLMEGYQPDYNARVYLDGQPVAALRLDEAFLGVRVAGAGEHEVRVVYGPRDLPLLLGASVLGLTLLGASAWWLVRVPQTDHARAVARMPAPCQRPEGAEKPGELVGVS